MFYLIGIVAFFTSAYFAVDYLECVVSDRRENKKWKFIIENGLYRKYLDDSKFREELNSSFI